MKGRDLIAAAVGAVVATALAGTVAWAAIPDAGGVIHTCYSKSQGTWRPIDFASEKCKAGETQLDFNQQGIKGDIGPQGLKGDKGDPGIQGLQGAKGDKGDAGPAGPSGVSGYQIVKGPERQVGLFDFATVDVTCPEGTRPLGGGARFGYSVVPDADSGYLEESYPTANGWRVSAHNTGPWIDRPLVPYAICAVVS